MARAPDERITQAKAMYLKGIKLVEIASQLNLPEGTVRRWKSTHNWEGERSDKNSERSVRKKGGQPGNKNATGPPENKNAETHGLFSKYLPEETLSIIQGMPKSPLDILWDNIQISYAAIVRSQQIMYVRGREDSTTTQIEQGYSDSGSSEKREIQRAWDKQGNFMQAQARAQSELRSLIKQYDEQLHKNWDMESEEQRARIDQIKAQTSKLSGMESEDELEKLDQVLSEIRGIK